ncbi:AzlC family ABC transporter permease [Acinetobacter sp. MD2(2019)]|uniref:AzlC family ABC transporter permease n=1 Tax=Acinetobacter sp. MD2(2019) TaxID=2605273 RepID=UPI002D1ED2F3|nr:AzlC family ABC transporter permease [Acinetobacter sp. MD2(2019)]MEB3753998.1 AzlC family ABC transporter permease [Acinetobacter sp. MD2(2019)]
MNSMSCSGSLSFRKRPLFQGVIAIMPLSIAVVPWGILAGSMAVKAGLSFAKAFAMSSLVFAGAAQLVSLSMVMEGASTLTIFITIFFLTSQHFIYALSLRHQISVLALRQRLALGFLLTDELFAVSLTPENRHSEFMLGAGICFYLFWVTFSAVGILLAQMVPDLMNYHLDFSIVAIFIAMIVPLITNLKVVLAVLVTCLSGFILRVYQIEGAVLISGLLGMMTPVGLAYFSKEREE